MKSAQDIANFFLSHSYDGEMDDISNLKLQKLLYYAQGYSLALLGHPIFDDPITAWEHGPVVETVYRSYKQHGKRPLPPLQDYNLSHFNEDELIILNRVANDYGQYSAWKLRNMTHAESPWLNTPRDFYIENDTIKTYFMKKLKQPAIQQNIPFDFDLEEMQEAVKGPFVTVPKLESPEAILAWMNSLTPADFTES